MPRFYLNEFNTPNYRESLPEHDPNNAIWPRLSELGKMLHDISWEEDEYDDGTGRSPEERKADFEQNARENMKTEPSKQMDGYSQYMSNVQRTAPTTASEVADVAGAAVQEQKDPFVAASGGHGASTVDMDRQRALAEGEVVGGTKRKAERLKNAFRKTGPDDFGIFFPDVFSETEESKKAMSDYAAQLEWENDVQRRQLEARSKMAGYRPNQGR